jgi:hypothetical protein
LLHWQVVQPNCVTFAMRTPVQRVEMFASKTDHMNGNMNAAHVLDHRELALQFSELFERSKKTSISKNGGQNCVEAHLCRYAKTWLVVSIVATFLP